MRWRFAAAGAAAALVVPGVALAASSAPQPQLVRTGNVLAGLSGLRADGPAPAGQVLSVGVALRARNTAAEDAAIARGQSFTPAEVARRFGARPAAAKAVVAWLKAGGLSVDSVAATGDWIAAHGTVAQVQRRFDVRELRYTVGGERFVANDRAPAVPAGDDVLAVMGLNTLQRFSLPQRPAAKAAGLPNTFGSSPQDLWSVYEQPAAWAGQGQAVAVFGEGKTAGTVHDLRLFEHKFALPKVPVRVVCVQHGDCGTDNSGQPEWDIDTQASTGMAPRVSRLDLYFAKSLIDPDVETAFAAWVNDPRGARQANASFGECEQDPLNPVWENPALAPVNVDGNPSATAGHELGNDLETVAEQTLRHAAAEGRTLFASTGDTGSSCAAVVGPVVGAGNGVANQGVPLLNYPAASRYAVAVGGTVLYTDGGHPARRSLEYAWTFGGGGTSVFLPAPAWQAAQPHVVGRCLTTSTGATSDTGQLCRGIPDVAAQSGDVLGNGYDVVMDGQYIDGGGAGTSLSSPLWVGMWARVSSAARHGAAGFAPPLLYRAGDGSAYGRDFTDVTVGGNGLYVARPGWDYVSGFGTPRVAGLIHDIDHR